MDTQVLPAPPTAVTPTPPRKTHHARNVLLALGGFFLLAGIISNATEDKATTPVDDSPPAVSAPDNDNTLRLAAGQAAPLMTQAADEIALITPTSSVSSDVEHLNTAAGLLDDAAALFDDGVEPTIAGYLHSAAEHLVAAAVAEAAGDFSRMNVEIVDATSDLQAANDYMTGR